MSMVIQTDALIIGAGPCGLFQVFELGLLGIKADIVDSLPAAGGQCTWLYPDKPIYDIPAVPVCTGAGLVANLMTQIEPFKPSFHLGEEVVALEPFEGGFRVKTAAAKEFHAKTVFIAGGVGSFQPRKLHLDGADALEERFIHYRVQDPALFKGKRLAILGGGDSALDWALALGADAAAITLIHRRDDYRAAPASVAQLKSRAASGAVEIIESANATALRCDGGRLTGLGKCRRHAENRCSTACCAYRRHHCQNACKKSQRHQQCHSFLGYTFHAIVSFFSSQFSGIHTRVAGAINAIMMALVCIYTLSRTNEKLRVFAHIFDNETRSHGND